MTKSDIVKSRKIDANFKKHLAEVEQRLRRFKSNATNVPDVYKTELEVWWISAGDQKAQLKKYSFGDLSHFDQVSIWKAIWDASGVLEVKSQALLYFQSRREHPDLLKDWPMIKSMVTGIENWAHSDTLSDIYARLLEKHPSKIMPTLKKWNKSKNPWMRRQSLVSLFYYQALRRTYPPAATVFKLISPLLKDPHYYVQKGVGWTLREAIQVYPKQTKAFIEKNLFDLSSIAFTTVMEKAPEKYKAKLKKQRKEHRMKKRFT